MSKLWKSGIYHEKKEHPVKRKVWCVLNATLFPLLPNRGRRWLLEQFGAKCPDLLVYRSARIFAPWNLVMKGGSIGPGVEIYNKAKVAIGENVTISQDAYICTASHDISSDTMRLVLKEITIADDVWIAAKAVILPGAAIGEGAVVGAAAVVAKSVPPWTVVAGNPAREIGKREIAG